MRSLVAEPLQPGDGEHQRVVLAGIELPQPRVDVAANRQEARAGMARAQLRAAPDAARPDRRRRRRARVAPARSTSASRESSRGRTAAIAEARRAAPTDMSLALWTARSMAPREQRVLDFLDEQPLAAHLGQRRVLQPIARRLDDADLARAAAALEQRRDRARLPQRERAAARPDPHAPS